MSVPGLSGTRRVTVLFDAGGQNGATRNRSSAETLGIVSRVDFVQGAHDLGRAPSLVNTQVGDDVWNLPAAIATEAVDGVARRGEAAAANRAASRDHAGDGCEYTANNSKRRVGCTDIDDLRVTAGFGRDAAREAIAELRGVGEHFLAAVAGVGFKFEAVVAERRLL